jgi:hypothetical protein
MSHNESEDQHQYVLKPVSSEGRVQSFLNDLLHAF